MTNVKGKFKFSLILIITLIIGEVFAGEKVLVFTKIGMRGEKSGFRHKSIPDAVEAFKKLSQTNDFEMTHSEDSSLFTDENLKKYQLIVFLSTSGELFTKEQRLAFENYYKNGGAFLGIHGAAATYYKGELAKVWPWYHQMLGGIFRGHPPAREGTIILTDTEHQACKGIPQKWTRFDEWYRFEIRSDQIKILMTQEKKGKASLKQPLVWCQDFDGGRSIYTALGDTKDSWKEELFLKHIMGCITYALRR